ncbi:uncharacterized protein DSM5745_04888 [Aspergillus mulundensis]|uniref:CCHC-type domain-containing protein n=1 Tax=Aspergillus mulundensis TaxID=1810919 RepID=A0A3D8S5F5_9EURO|nr:hypothetical protein DSM5745_04888 [Aspergillus mulundensis]RDW81331.1 hypothetical protein DSM5745_04888 [Aspergillus mulundensis]
MEKPDPMTEAFICEMGLEDAKRNELLSDVLVEVKCVNCNKPGHRARDYQQPRVNSIERRNCRFPEHKTSECMALQPSFSIEEKGGIMGVLSLGFDLPQRSKYGLGQLRPSFWDPERDKNRGNN